jgi:hypothetical protein
VIKLGRRAIAISAGSVLLVLIVSPLLLVSVGMLLHLDWVNVTNIGQSYTGVSAILSALAVIGVIYSINLQGRQVELARSQAVRQMQFDLLRLAMDQKKYASVIQPKQLLDHDHDMYSIDIYRTQWFRYLQFSFLAGEISTKALRATLANNILHVKESRDWWARVDVIWTAEGADASPRCKEFMEIVREECTKAGAPESHEIAAS